MKSIHERLRRCGKKSRVIRRVVRDQLPIHGLLVGNYVAFHEHRYCFYVPAASAWFEIDRLCPLVEDYLTKTEELDAGTDQ